MATNPDEPKTKFCMSCGAPLPEHAALCPHCGKEIGNAVKASVSHDWKVRKEESKEKHVRVCSKCNALIESRILSQCPICGNILPELIPQPEETAEYVFHGGKQALIPTSELKLDPNKWKLKEMGAVFMYALISFLFIEFAVVLMLQWDTLLDPNALIEPVETTMSLILIGSGVGVFLGVYPLLYIYTQKMSFENKLSLKFSWVGVLIGILVGIGLFYILILGSYLNSLIATFMPGVNDAISSATLELSLIHGASPWEQLLFGILFSARNLMEEVLFRGVLLKGLNDGLPAKRRTFYAILLSSLLYAGIFAILNFSLAFFVTNFLLNLVLSLTFYISRKSTATTMVAQVVFSVIYTLTLVLLPL